ncbi:hypothetical protein SynA18461_00339 [Synechococcus sp. A18-46.1]|nr:hypothetical protein SynA18461_00339 [Synechococcus sp. A18-46.1]
MPSQLDISNFLVGEDFVVLQCPLLDYLFFIHLTIASSIRLLYSVNIEYVGNNLMD